MLQTLVAVIEARSPKQTNKQTHDTIPNQTRLYTRLQLQQRQGGLPQRGGCPDARIKCQANPKPFKRGNKK